MLKKTLELVTYPSTVIKKGVLKELFSRFNLCCSKLWDCIEYWDEIPRPEQLEKLTSINLHHLTYRHLREVSGLPANIVETARRQVYDLRKSERIGNLPIRFDNRTISFKSTNKGYPVITIATHIGRLAIPVIPNRLWARYKEHLAEGWTCNSVLINFRNNRLTIQPVLTKEIVLRDEYDRILGIDVNVGNFAAITVHDPSNDRVLRQHYFGRDIVGKQRDICIRRSKLQSYKATKKLRRLKGYENNFIRTRFYQISNEIVRIAKRFNSVIAIENLKHVIEVNFGTKINRKVHRWAYGQFFKVLEQVANEKGIRVEKIDPAYTSQTCCRCGHTSKSNRKHWHLFKCQECNFEVNPDRNASVNISKKLFSVRGPSYFNRRPQDTGNGMVVDPSFPSYEVIASS